MPSRHGPTSPCPGYLEEQYIDGGSGRVSCPWCASEMARDGGGNVVHMTKPGGNLGPLPPIPLRQECPTENEATLSVDYENF